MNTKLKLFYAALFLVAVFMICSVILAQYFIPKNQPTSTPPAPLPTSVLPPQESINNVVNQIQNKKPLASSERLIRQSLIVQTDSNGVIKTTSNYRFHYITKADVFQVEILTTDVTTAINDSITWLKSLGLSEQGICSLPLVIYRDPKAFDQTLTAGLEFYPLPFGCQQ